jgi:hypothetical protein
MNEFINFVSTSGMAKVLHHVDSARAGALALRIFTNNFSLPMRAPDEFTSFACGTLDPEGGQSMNRLRGILAAAILVFTAAPSVFAASITLNATDTGQYTDAGFHDPTNPNYLAGQITGFATFRNWATFDLSTLAGQTITGASLALYNPLPGYSSPDATETYTLFDVSTDIATLQAGGSGKTSIYTDLGDGTIYGTRSVSAADNDTVVVTLFNAAGVGALNLATGGSFAVGGAVTTLSGSGSQYLFGNSGSGVRELRLELADNSVTAVPEPTSLLLLGTGILGTGVRRYRSRHAK